MDDRDQRIRRFLVLLHRAPRATGLEELARANRGAPVSRTLYRWHRGLADDLIYYPNVSLNALGLDHVHLFVNDPCPGWEAFPYAVASEWVVRQPGQRTLYLHCVIPREHTRDVLTLLRTINQDITSITTRDGWQLLGDASDPQDMIPPLFEESHRTVWEVVERVPLLIPVIFENIEQRRSFPQVWHQIYGRLGARAWDYLPRGARRLPTNGKMYVRDAYALLNHASLFRQNVIRFSPRDELTTSMFLHVTGAGINTMASAFAQGGAWLDTHPVGATEALLRVTASPPATQRIMSTTAQLPKIAACYFVDQLTPAPRVRFAYELLFDPGTTEWRLPRDEILQQLGGYP